MTPKELREKVEPILLNNQLTNKEKAEIFTPILRNLFQENSLIMDDIEVFKLWNETLVDILQERGKI